MWPFNLLSVVYVLPSAEVFDVVLGAAGPLPVPK